MKASFLNLEEKLLWKQLGDSLNFVAPIKAVPIATIIELTMEKKVSASFSAFNNSIFNDPAYGTKIKTEPIKINEWKNNQKEIDLGKVENVTGLGLSANDDRIKISVSVNGKEWQNLDLSGHNRNEISLTTFIAGAHVLGCNIRYIRLHILDRLADLKVDIYSK
ncbi:discoidin domain-containing protein [Pedobacter lusitanus]|uniref:discoidin domain-containing protein n=1 Tax=Pedobacter lusitanus TaxID=1503925 RepID=UPI000B32F37D|nr:discoidin domain-containing protein [Pedobacter lusitanus]